jgi:GTPase
MTEIPENSRAGFVALIGEPNAGKSTLLNRMVGAKVSIVTHKVQTTRARIRGVCMEGVSQIVFVDTPGIFRPRRRLDRSMVKAAWGGASDADVVVLLIEATRGITEGVEAIVGRIADEMPKGKPVALAINKIDRVKAESLLELAEACNAAFPFARTFMISAEKGYGVKDLREWLAEQIPAGPWYYPEDQIADLPMRMIAAEMTREKLTLRLHEELPYQLTRPTARRGSTRSFMSRGMGTRGFCWGQKARRSNRSDRQRGPKSRSFWAERCIFSCRSRCGRTGLKNPSGFRKWDWISRTAMPEEPPAGIFRAN